MVANLFGTVKIKVANRFYSIGDKLYLIFEQKEKVDGSVKTRLRRMNVNSGLKSKAKIYVDTPKFATEAQLRELIGPEFPNAVFYESGEEVGEAFNNLYKEHKFIKA
jgi:hypothetical protein